MVNSREVTKEYMGELMEDNGYDNKNCSMKHDLFHENPCWWDSPSLVLRVPFPPSGHWREHFHKGKCMPCFLGIKEGRPLFPQLFTLKGLQLKLDHVQSGILGGDLS